MLKNENQNENSDQENEDMIFKWIDDIESQPIKKRVSFSNKNKIHFIETREEIGWLGLNMYMSKFHFKLIEDEFKKEYSKYLQFNKGQTSKSRDQLALQICEFIEKQSSKDSLEEFNLSKE